MNDPHHLDLHSELLNDASGARSAAVLARLQGMHADCLAAERRLGDRESYRRALAATAAVTASIQVVKAVAKQGRRGGN